MKAIILAGGSGTRGKPYTDYFPKAMIPIRDVPLIQYIIKYLGSYPFIHEIIIISDYKKLGSQIQNYLEKNKAIPKKNIKFIQDSQSGTGGDLLHATSALKGTEKFVLWFVDNFCAIDLDAMKKQFDAQNSIACIATRTKRKEETGFAKISTSNIITEFREKPTIRLPLSECLGIYILNTKILDTIKQQKSKKRNSSINLSYDILEQLAKKSTVNAYDIGNKEWLDIESPKIIDRNQKQVDKIIRQMNDRKTHKLHTTRYTQKKA